ncbi:Chitinase 2 [Hyphodiscus hymeniophilus]|uniref:Chitinase 2 n=1 Tax=Hyphodiscus hymeniophilus TaxID=353542 RepID=A0A9P6VLY0_9HELO|nr:Chitinase 2 [Hyphodiscus hymeniophilus]
MYFPKVLTLGLLAGAASAAPHSVSSRATRGQNVVYWGQNGGGTVENNDLSAYCTPTSGIDVIVLAFLYEFGNGVNIPSGTIGQSCYISTSGEGQNCDNVASSIATCQAAGVKIILSLGGASGAYSLQSASQAAAIGQYVWESYADSGNTTVQRPFGNNFVNGFDFDIEVNLGNQYYPAMISQIRSNFASDSSHTYYITGAPQCPIPEPNMGEIISAATFDYLFVQFYNNNNYTYPCSLGFDGNAANNYNQWVSFIAGTPSAAAKIFFGVPAAPLAANGSPSGETYYITPTQLATLVAEYDTSPAFGGIMMWSAGFSDTNVVNGCTYAQQAHSILLTGSPCSGSGPVPPTTTAKTSTATHAPTSTSTSHPATATPTGAPVAQWGQVSTLSLSYDHET